MKPEKLDRLGDRVPELPQDVCWPWQGNMGDAGYGQAYDPFTKRTAGAHRVVWKLMHGPIADDHHVDHLCHDPGVCDLGVQCPHRSCVNPAHLASIPAPRNILRSSGPSAENAAKTHCKRGHEFTPENTSIEGRGARRCRTCKVERFRRETIANGGTPRPRRRTFNPGAAA